MTQEDTTSALPSEKPAEDTTKVAPVPGSSEYDAAMIAKFDKHTGQGGEPSTPQKPDDIPEKFWDADKGVVRTEELLKSYKELEKNRTQQHMEKPVEAVDAPKDSLKLSEAEAAVGVVDMAKFNTEFMEKGELSTETYESLAKSGIPKEMVDGYIEGQKALAAERDNAGFNLVGGKEAFDKIASWAKQSLPVSDREAFNKAVAGSDAEMKMAMMGLKAQYEASNGKEPSLAGGNAAPSGSSGYESTAQMTADMRDPRYKTDTAYRQKVANKLSNTTAF